MNSIIITDRSASTTLTVPEAKPSERARKRHAPKNKGTKRVSSKAKKARTASPPVTVTKPLVQSVLSYTTSQTAQKVPPVHVSAVKISVERKPVVPVRKSTGAQSSAPKSIAPSTRVEQFPQETLTVRETKLRGAQLWCTCCSEPVNTKLSVLKNHLESTKHANNRTTHQNKLHDTLAVEEQVRAYLASQQLEMETLDAGVLAHRVRVLRILLQAGILTFWIALICSHPFRHPDSKN